MFIISVAALAVVVSVFVWARGEDAGSSPYVSGFNKQLKGANHLEEEAAA